MDELKLKSLQNENGFNYRKQTNRINRVKDYLSFCLISQNQRLSSNYYGVPALTSLRFDISAECLKHTKFVSYDYEKYLNQEPIESSFLKKSNTVSNGFSKNIQNDKTRTFRRLKRTIKPCSVRLKRLELKDLLNYNLSKESRGFVIKRFEPQNIKLSNGFNEEDDDIILLSEEEVVEYDDDIDDFIPNSTNLIKANLNEIIESKSPNHVSINTEVSSENRNPHTFKQHNNLALNNGLKSLSNGSKISYEIKSFSKFSLHPQKKVTSYKTLYRSYQNGQIVQTQYIKYSKYSPMASKIDRTILKENPVKKIKHTYQNSSGEQIKAASLSFDELKSVNKQIQLEKTKFKNSLTNLNNSTSINNPHDIDLIDLTI